MNSHPQPTSLQTNPRFVGVGNQERENKTHGVGGVGTSEGWQLQQPNSPHSSWLHPNLCRVMDNKHVMMHLCLLLQSLFSALKFNPIYCLAG
jgi:hypothetical protein